MAPPWRLTRTSTRPPCAVLTVAPSAGALYAGEVYVVAERVQGLAKGVYYYDLYNEPNQLGESGGWCQQGGIPQPEYLAEIWADAARTIYRAGGYPGNINYRILGFGMMVFLTAVIALNNDMVTLTQTRLLQS